MSGSANGDPMTMEHLLARYERTRTALVSAANRGRSITPEVALEYVEATEIYVDALHLLLTAEDEDQEASLPLQQPVRERPRRRAATVCSSLAEERC